MAVGVGGGGEEVEKRLESEIRRIAMLLIFWIRSAIVGDRLTSRLQSYSINNSMLSVVLGLLVLFLSKKAEDNKQQQCGTGGNQNDIVTQQSVTK